MTGEDLISAAMRVAGVLASGETPSAAEAADATVILNQMLEAWGAERLNVYTLNINTFALTPGTQNYTVAAGGTFNLARPARIERMSIQSLNNPAQPLELPIEMLSDEEWQAIPVKNITSSLPSKVYDDGGFPSRTLSFWPIPSVAVNAVMYSWSPLSQFTDLTTDVTFPPGYIDAIKYNLAVRIAAEWPGAVSPLALQLAQQGLARIKSLNVPDVIMKPDNALSNEGGRYNWITDRYQ